MDYTLSDGYATHAVTGHRLHQLDQPVPTEVTEKDLNSVIWSLMEIINAAGLTPQQFNKDTPATYQVLLNALRSAGVFLTQPNSDNSTKAATTAWVKNVVNNASSPVAGYQSHPSGLVIQWGYTTPPINVSSAACDVVFPIQFPTACTLCVGSTGINAADYSIGSYRASQATLSVGVPTRTGCQMEIFVPNAIGDGRRVQFIAIGY